MKFQIGDKVLLLHSNEEGEVIDIINDKMVMVDIKGVKFPAYIDQLDFPYFKRFTEKQLFPSKKELPAGTQGKAYIDDIKKEKSGQVIQKENGVWLTFLPVMKTEYSDSNLEGEEVVKELKMYLHNQTNQSYNFIYELHFFGEPDFELKNELHPFEDFYLHDILFDHMNDSPSFEFKFSLKQPITIVAKKNKAEYLETSFRLKPKQLFAKLKELKEKNESSFSFRLFEIYPDKKTEQEFYIPEPKRQRTYDLSTVRQHIEPALSVIDLHIEKLADDWQRLSNFEMLTLQLKTFEKYYDLAVLHLQPSLIVIHGIGSGRLRDEIHNVLRTKKEVKSYANQYHSLYGYGATEIFFQY